MLLVVAAANVAADEADDRKQIQTARQQWMKAFFAGDTETMDRLETDGFIVIAAKVIQDKKTQLAGIKQQKETGNWFPPGIVGVDVDVKTRFVGDNVAIVSGHVANKIPGEEDPRMQFAITEVWQRTGDGWRTAHLHFHPLEDSDGN
jgi:ketosteroid isomerase-like protein